jgi:hypothetical protein
MQLVICLLSHFIHIWYLGWPWSEHSHIIPISRMVNFCESCSPFHVCLTIHPFAHVVYATSHLSFYTPAPRRGREVYCFTSVLPSVQDIFRRIFLSNCWWQKSDIWSQASYRYTILWVAFLDPSDSYFLFADLVGFYTHWTYMHIFLSNYWWQKSDIWSQASYRYPISWEAFLNPSDSYLLFAEERGCHKWALAHSSSCVAFYSYLVSWLAMIWAFTYYTNFTDGWFLWEL